MLRACCSFCLVIFLIAACDKPEPAPLQVGDHAISLLFPEGWEHVDYGNKHQFRRDMNRISLDDLGRRGSYIELAIDRAMVILREDGRREEASRDTLQVTGREARLIDTWDHLSHQYRKRYLFVLNERSLLVAYTMQGDFEAMEPVFTELTASLAFVDSLGVPGDGD